MSKFSFMGVEFDSHKQYLEAKDFVTTYRRDCTCEACAWVRDNDLARYALTLASKKRKLGEGVYGKPHTSLITTTSSERESLVSTKPSMFGKVYESEERDPINDYYERLEEYEMTFEESYDGNLTMEEYVNERLLDHAELEEQRRVWGAASELKSSIAEDLDAEVDLMDKLARVAYAVDHGEEVHLGPKRPIPGSIVCIARESITKKGS